MDDSYDFSLVDSFEGYVTSKDKTNVAPNVLVRGSRNVYKKDSGNISIREGLKRLGLADSTFQGIVASFEWDTSLGYQRPLRVLAATSAGNDGKLQVMYDIPNGLWADLQTGLSLTKYVFDTYWDDTLKKDKLIMVRGDANLYSWEGGQGNVASVTINTIVLTADAAQNGFAAPAGSVLINGVTYAYTGITTTTLTGVSPDPTGTVAGALVLSTVDTHTNKPDASFINDFIKTIGNQLYCGSYTSRLVYISKSDDFTDFSVPSPRVSGDAELLTLDDNPRGITVRQGNAHIPAGLYAWYVVSFQDITVGAALTQQTVVDKQEVAAQTTALSHDFIDTVGDDIIYMDQENQVRIYGIFRNIVQAKYPSISQQIRDELREVDFTGGALRAIGDFVYITSPITGFVYMHEAREAIDGSGNVIAERLWHPPQTWQGSRVALIDGIEYMHSAINPQLYQMWDTMQWFDDSPSNEPIAYDAVMAMSYRNTERRQGLTTFDKVYFEGYMTEGTELLAFVLADYQGASGQANPTINSVQFPAKFYMGGFSPSLGDSSLGVNPLGIPLSEAEDDQELLPKFRAITNVSQVNCFEYQIVVYSQAVDSRWEILALGPNAKITRNQQAGFLCK